MSPFPDAVSQTLYGLGRRGAAGAFALQSRADAARVSGNLELTADLGSAAAFQLGIVEQQRLQRMWDDPLLAAFAKANALALSNGWSRGLARPVDIYVGVNKYRDNGDPSQTLGYIRAPELANPDVSQFDVRRSIAQNAFNFMHDNVFAPRAVGNTHNFYVVQNAFTQMLNPSSLYKMWMPPLIQWPL